MSSLPQGYKPVESSNLAAIGFFELASGRSFLDDLEKACATERSGRLEVMFKNGTRYSYASVPAVLVNSMLGAPSIGNYFYRAVAANKEAFPCTKMEPYVPGPGDAESH